MKKLLLLFALAASLGTSATAQSGCNAYFYANTNGCPQILFNNYSSVDSNSTDFITSWNWTFGDGGTSTSMNPAHTYASNSSYTVCLSITTNQGCQSTYCETININCIGGGGGGGGCQAAFYQDSASNCPTISLYDASSSTSGIAFYYYDFGDGSISTSANPTHTYAANGLYTVCLTISTQDSCASTYCENVLIDCIGGGGGGSCQAAFYQDSASNCPTISLYDASTASSGVWLYSYDFGDGTTSTSANPTHTYTANGVYIVCLTIYAQDSCTSTYCETVIVDCLGGQSGCQASFYQDSSACPTVSLVNSSTSSGSISSYYYDFGDGSNSSSANPTHTYTANGTYTICLTIVADSCIDTYCQTIQIGCIAGLEETVLENSYVSPNPAQNQLILHLDQAHDIRYRIYGMNGSLYDSGERSAANAHHFELNNLEQGIYLLEIETEGAREVLRFMKE